MAFRDQLRDFAASLLGVSAYQPSKGYGLELDDEQVKQAREAVGGSLQPIPTTRIRWYLAELEYAQAQADAGNLRLAAQLHRAIARDGVLRGLQSTRCAGLVRLPKKFYGDDQIANDLRAQNGSRSVFDEMIPPSELALLDWDGIDLGVGIGELVPVPGRDYPVLVRLEPEFLQYRWNENRWYYLSIAGALPITPGDGRWVMHVPGGRTAPWNSGLWPALGESWINKQHAKLNRSNYSGKLANAARVAVSPQGASETQRNEFFQRLMAWGRNTVFGLPVGWDVKLIESNGRGIEVFQKEIDTSDNEMMVALCGQVVTVTGGTGFANAGIHETIREDLIQADGESLAYTINTQVLPAFIATRYGLDAISKRTTTVQWDTAKPKDLAQMGAAITSVGTAIKQLDEALAPHELRVAAKQLVERFAIPVTDLTAKAREAATRPTLAPVSDERRAA